MKLILRGIVILSVLSFSSFQMLAQEPPEPGMQESSGAPPPPPVGLPIDDYLPLLGIAGIAYGVYLSRKLQKT